MYLYVLDPSFFFFLKISNYKSSVFLLVILQANTKCKFDETLEAHVKMTPDLRRTDLVITWSRKS